MRGLKAGDIFEVYIDEGKQFFQFLVTDKTCLNGHVIRAFDCEKKLDELISLNDILSTRVKFYTHTYLQAGVKLRVWKKIGNVPIEDVDIPTFRHTGDTRDSRIKKSYNWYIWRVNGPTIEIGQLTGKYTDLSVGGITHPLDIVKRMGTGVDVLEYPT